MNIVPHLRLVKDQPKHAAAKILIQQFTTIPAANSDWPSPAEITQILPEVLTEILDNLLHSYDYMDNLKETPAVCFRMLAGVIAAIEFNQEEEHHEQHC